MDHDHSVRSPRQDYKKLVAIFMPRDGYTTATATQKLEFKDVVSLRTERDGATWTLRIETRTGHAEIGHVVAWHGDYA